MIEIEIFRDIKDQKAKLVGSFTARQLVCFAGLAVSCVLTYRGAAAVFGRGNSLNMFFPVIAVVPFALLGWVAPYGQPFEKFALVVLKTYILPPVNRVYTGRNIYEEFEEYIKEEGSENGTEEKGKRKNTEKRPGFAALQGSVRKRNGGNR